MTSKTAPDGTLPRTLLYVALALTAVGALSYNAVVATSIVGDVLHPAPSPAQPLDLSAMDMQVHKPDRAASAAGVQKGDELVAINDVPVHSMNEYQHLVSTLHPGARVDLTLQRHAQRVHKMLAIVPARSEVDESGGVALGIVLGVIMPIFSSFVGIYVAAVRPRDPIAWTVLAFLLSYSQTIGINAANLWGSSFRIPANVYHWTLFYFWPLFLFLFAYYFPEPPSLESRFPWLKWILIAPFTLFGFFYVPVIVGVLENPRAFIRYAEIVNAVSPYSFAVIALLIMSSISLFAMKAARATSSDSRRRLRLLFWGLVTSLTPLLIIFIVVLAARVPENKLPMWVFLVCLTPMILLPMAIAYVIVVDRAMDVRVALRQGLQYTFARGGLTALRLATLALFAWIGWDLAHRFTGNTPALVLLSAALLGIVLLINLSVRRLGAWVDRRFFREAYNAETVLTDLTEEVRTIRETGSLLDTVCNRIGSTLHVARIAIVLQQDGHYVTRHSIGFDPQPDIRFSSDSALVGVLNSVKEAPRVYFEDDDSWLYRTPGLDDAERSKLATLGSELLLPLTSRHTLLGFISAGQKRSEEPYSKSDVRILLTVAAQTGLALENAQLTTAIAAEAAQRQRLASEVEIAREVQERLFPQTLPKVTGLDYSGLCRTALGVGGDYYDFLPLTKDRFGFAVADVAGKGISAALMMASLQASLRGEMTHVTDDLAGMMGNLNRRVYEASTSNRYATFFFAVYTPATCRLDYVNAGHNPPILMRRQGREWTTQTLDASGTVVGLLPNSAYEQAAVTLQSGDYLVAFTDGISEAMNHNNDEWGEERLTETLRACAESSLSANETMHRILSAADTFVAGAKQHDDMTLVVLRVL